MVINKTLKTPTTNVTSRINPSTAQSTHAHGWNPTYPNIDSCGPTHPNTTFDGQCVTRSFDPMAPTETQIDPRDPCLYQIIALTLSMILKSNNKVFIVNAADCLGEITVDIVHLVVIIGITCEALAESVTVEYERREVACCKGGSTRSLMLRVSKSMDSVMK